MDERNTNRVDLNETLKNVIANFSAIITKKKASVSSDLLPVIYGDPVQMNCLFHGLISNALKFSKQFPVVTILSAKAMEEDFFRYSELVKDIQYVSVSIHDNGIGFNEKYAKKIFKLFQRLYDLKDVDGTGAGLTICKKIVEDHGGFIFAKGKIDDGAVFTIFLPAYHFSNEHVHENTV